MGTAAQTCRAVREGFLRRDLTYDAALVSLDLASLYLEQGRTGEVKALAGEMLRVFRSREIHREATAALLLFSAYLFTGSSPAFDQTAVT